MMRVILISAGGAFFLGAVFFLITQAASGGIGGGAASPPERLGAPVQKPDHDNAAPPPQRLKNPRIVIKKGERKLYLYDADKLVKTYRVGLGFAPEGDKQVQGDGKTPEGEFYIFVKNPKSSFYLSLGLSYPSADDAERGLREKIISKKQHDAIVGAVRRGRTPPQNTALGGDIYIHGGGSASDWTLGCIALTNEEMKELFDAVPAGTRVSIQP